MVKKILNNKVFSNIRLVNLLAFCGLTLLSGFLQAQEPVIDTQKADNTAAIQSTHDDSTNTVIANDRAAEIDPPARRLASNEQPILRLEDTIRGNKEQPQVLTIVPWQLPVHQRINENSEWQLQVKQLNSIERNAFLRNLAVVNEFKRAPVKQEVSGSESTNNNPSDNN